MRCSARTAPARARWSNASWATTAPTRAASWSADREYAIEHPRAAHALGLGMVYQHFTLVPAMTVAENFVLARPELPAVIDWRKEKARARSLPRAHAVPRAARRQGVGDLGRRAAEVRDPQAALSAAPLPDARRADLGAHARRGRRGARHAARDGGAERADDPDDHPQVPRGDGVRRRGDDPAARPARPAAAGSPT